MGKILDNLSFNLPELPVQTSDPNQLFEGEPQLEMQKAQRDIQSMENLRAFAGQVLQTGSRVAAPIIQRGKEAAEKAGVLAGEYAAFNVSGDTFEERNNNFKLAFKQMRANKDIGLIDDPYFIRGLHKAQGVGALRLLDQEMEKAYERMKSNPTFFSDPDMYETEIRRLYDTIYTSLPDSIDLQEGFLSKSRSLLDNYNLQYRKDSNEYNRKEYLSAQTNKVGAIFYDYNLESDNIDQLAGSDLKEKWLEVSEIVLNQLESGELTKEELGKYIPSEYVENPLEYFGNVYGNEEEIKSSLKAIKFAESIEDVQEVYDDLYNFGDEGLGGLGADPTDLMVAIVSDNIESPTQAMRIISSLRSGTGMLSATDRGKSALSKLYPKALDEERIKRNRTLQERNRTTAEALRGKALDIALIDADINSFAQILFQNQSTGEGPQSPEELQAILTERIAFLQDIDPDGYASRVGKIREHVNKARSPYSAYSDREKQDQVAEGMQNIFKAMSEGQNPTQTALNIMSTHSVLGTATDRAFEGYINEGFRYYQEALTNPEADANDIAGAQERFWQTASVINELGQMGGPSYSMNPVMSSERAVLNNPLYMAILGEAEDKGVLSAFVSPSTRLGKTAIALRDSNLPPEAYAQAFAQEFEKIEAQEKAQLEEREFKRDVGFSPENIPFYDATGKRTLLGSKDLLVQADPGIKKVTDINALPGASLQHIVKVYGDLYNGFLAEGFSKEDAGKQARLRFRERFEIIQAKTGTNKGELVEGFTGGDRPVEGAIYLLADNQHRHGAYLYSLQSDEEERHRGVESFLKELQFLSTEDPLTAANAKVEEYQKEVAEQIVQSMKQQQPSPYEAPTVQPIFDQEVYTSVRSSMEQMEINPPRVEGEDVDAYMRRLLNKNAVISSFDQAFDLYKKGVSEFYEAFEGEEQVDLFISNAVDAYMRQVKKGDPTILRNQFKDLFLNADRNNITGAKTFDPGISYMEQRARELRIRDTLRNQGVTPFLGMVLSDEAARNFTDAREVAKNLEETQLDFRGFDLYDSDTNIFMYPVDDYNFIIVNQNGETLNYKRTNRPFTFGIEDIGDAIQREQIKTPQDLWRDIGRAINPEVRDVTREDLERELTNYFDAFPDTLPLAYFVRRFRGNGKAVYQYYKQIKGL